MNIVAAGRPGTPAPASDAVVYESIADVRWRGIVRVEGRIRSMRVRPWAGEARTLECTVVDDTGGIELVFLGRSSINGLRLGTRLGAEGRLGAHHGRLAILNPRYELRPPLG